MELIYKDYENPSICLNESGYIAPFVFFKNWYINNINEVNNIKYVTSENNIAYCDEANIITKININEEKYFDLDKAIIDIGGGHGIYSFRTEFKYAYTFEPNKKMYHILCTNMIIHNKYDTSKIYNVMLSNKSESIEYDGAHGMLDDQDNVFFNDIPKNDTNERYLTNIVTHTLDEFNCKNVGLIKVDVEGMEEKVLRGGIETIKNNNYPPILFELWDVGECGMNQEKHDSLQKFLEDLGYEILWYWGDYETHLAIHKDKKDDSKIDWKKYADYIFCLNYLPNNRKESISQKLTNLGIDINDNEFFSFSYDIDHNIFKDHYNDMMEKSFNIFNQNAYYTKSYLDKDKHDYIFYLGSNIYHTLKIAQHLNYKRIILFEDDLLFLKDHNYIIKAMDFIKTQDFDICMCQTNFMDAWAGIKSEILINDSGEDLGNDMFMKVNVPLGLYGGGFIILTKSGIDKIVKYFEENNMIVCLDVLDALRDKMNLETIFALKPLCIQEHMLEWPLERQHSQNINMNVNEYDRF